MTFLPLRSWRNCNAIDEDGRVRNDDLALATPTRPSISAAPMAGMTSLASARLHPFPARRSWLCRVRILWTSPGEGSLVVPTSSTTPLSAQIMDLKNVAWGRNIRLFNEEIKAVVHRFRR
ncbi:hypothetical protein Pyn_22068 [Prunus yedoensis var. nudiflora]|uniref:Uncharacterized protein n=1 Tax=Prunus yedoensis var. nudiflora TaxID=2094558 RepID=A0A314XQT6_PRUYE|nr:hypothetical protein Pyn_22068 [Prunus yedoensis var. nudiflora]